jgi:hypothetical protein
VEWLLRGNEMVFSSDDTLGGYGNGYGYGDMGNGDGNGSNRGNTTADWL